MLKKLIKNIISKKVIYACAIYSLIVFLFGAIFTTMHCSKDLHPLFRYCALLLRDDSYAHFPFLKFGFTLFLFSLVLLLVKFIEDQNFKNILFTLNEKGEKWIYISLILVLAFLMRVNKLDEIPTGMNTAEAINGYNAYSISQIGSNSQNQFFPVFFKSFETISGPFFIYPCAFLLRFFEPSLFILRFVSVIFGVLGIFFTYKLAKIYFNNFVSLLSAFLLTLSPWHLFFSRVAVDSVVTSFFVIYGMYLFLKGIKDDDYKRFICSAFPISFSLYSYKTTFLFIPIMLLILVSLNLKKILNNKTRTLQWLSLLILLSMPFFYSFFNNRDMQADLFNSLVFGNNVVDSIKSLFKNYFNYISSSFLLKQGDTNLRHHIGFKGQLLNFTYWFSIIGAITLIFKKEKNLFIFPLWALIFPISAIVMKHCLSNADRTITALPVFEILASVGFYSSAILIYKLITNSDKAILGLLLLLVSALFISSSIQDVNERHNYYYKAYPKNSESWFENDIYSIVRVTKYLKQYDEIFIPVLPWLENILFLESVSPKDWIGGKYLFRYFQGYPDDLSKLNRSSVAVIRAGEDLFNNIPTSLYIYDRINGELKYEIKELHRK